MSPDVQEALSRRFGDDIIILLPLKSGKVAIFNAARELCGFAPQHILASCMAWRPPTKLPKGADFTLEDLGL